MSWDSGGWGDKGEEHRPDKCDHAPDDGCEWCCRTCNYDRHFCPGCGTVSDHFDTPCDECYASYHLARPHETRPMRWAEDDTAHKWVCGCGAKGRFWEDRKIDASDGHKRHRKRVNAT